MESKERGTRTASKGRRPTVILDMLSTQWTVFVPSVVCGMSLGALIGFLWSLSFQP